MKISGDLSPGGERRRSRSEVWTVSGAATTREWLPPPDTGSLCGVAQQGGGQGDPGAGALRAGGTVSCPCLARGPRTRPDRLVWPGPREEGRDAEPGVSLGQFAQLPGRFFLVTRGHGGCLVASRSTLGVLVGFFIFSFVV